MREDNCDQCWFGVRARSRCLRQPNNNSTGNVSLGSASSDGGNEPRHACKGESVCSVAARAAPMHMELRASGERLA
jgi:hypothetical protein